jgi:hypothetical protein
MIDYPFKLHERNFMKNLTTLTALVAFLAMALSSGVMAQCGMHGGPKAGGPMQCAAGAAVSPDTLKKFNKETKGLKEQLIDKQALLQKEFLKDDPDPDAIAIINKAIIDIQRDMQKIAKKLGMKPCYGSCGSHQGGCGGGGFGGGCGAGMPGCGNK